MSWNVDMVTTTGNVVIFDLLHNFHLECGARLHKLRVYETLSDPTGREVCGYLLVRGSVHAHAYALALKNLTGVAIEKMLPTCRTFRSATSPNARSTWPKARTAASTPSARPTTGDGRHLGQWRDGAAGRSRRASWRSSGACRKAARSTT
jgi:Mn-containing catalase